MLEDHPLLRIDHEVRLPLLTPFNSSTPKEIEEEVERRLEEGFRTFKIKVGTMRMRISSVSGLSSGPSPVAQLCE
jgi:L-alanine-DL-glutamate epimerase-like enolase superfamily enzyme